MKRANVGLRLFLALSFLLLPRLADERHRGGENRLQSGD